MTGLAFLDLTAAQQAEVQRIIQESMEQAGHQTGPKVKFVPRDHWMFDGLPKRANVFARAARTRDGGEYVYVNNDLDTNVFSPGAYQHEAGHIITWRDKGIKVKEHGPEFRRVCRDVVTDRPNHFCNKSFY